MERSITPGGSEPTQFRGEFLDHLLEGFQLIGFDWTYLYVNAAVALQGRHTKEELIGRKMFDVYPGIENTPMFSMLRRCMTDRVPCRMENEFVFADGKKGWFELVMEPVPDGVFILSADITERKRAQAAEARMQLQLRQAQKMDAIGNLAGGIVHDFNNLLSVILSYASSMQSELTAADEMWHDVSEIRKACDRATELTRKLLAFSPGQELKTAPIDLNQSLRHMQDMLRRVAGNAVAVELRPDAALHTVRADTQQLEQVVLNLVINARDAMPNGGKITIETANVYLDDEYTSGHHGVSEGDYAMLAISDSGVGMTQETQERIFEPFFTTKAQGKGTGLGLPTVYGVIKQSGGHVWVYSEPGQGTTFKIYLPAVRTGAAGKEPFTQNHVPQDSNRNSALLQSGLPETVLLVEDDAQVRRCAKKILSKDGYHVIEAHNAAEAIALANQLPSTISLLLTDVVMPSMGGLQLARQLRALLPELKIIYMSGHTDGAVFRQGLDVSKHAFVQKPLTSKILLNKVRTVLDQRL